MERKGERRNRKQDDDRGRADQERITASHFLNTVTGIKKKKAINSCDIVNPEKRASLANSHLRIFNTHRNVFITLGSDFPFAISMSVCMRERKRYRPLPASRSGVVSGSLGRHFLGTRRTAYTAVSVSGMFWMRCLHNPLSSHLKQTNTRE